MAATYLTRSRHETVYYFRRRVPDDLRERLGTRYIVQSLATSDRRSALVAARAHAAATDALFAALRSMPLNNLPHITGFTLRANYSDEGRVRSIEIDAQPHEADAVERLLTNPLLSPAPAAALPAAPLAPAMQTGPSSKTISQLFEDYKREKIALKRWKDGEDTARYDHLPHVMALIQAIGDKPIGDITAEDINHFHACVLGDENGGSMRNRDKRLTRAGALLRWAKQKRYIADAFPELFKLNATIEDNEYLLLDDADLKALFESDDYKHRRFKTPSEYWLPILGLYTGARLNELCQLLVSDVSTHEDVPTIAIIDDELSKRLKNKSSRRIVPIHSKLIELGLLEYAAEAKSGRLFPELPESTAREGDYSKEPSRRFTAYRRKVGVGTDLDKSGAPIKGARSRKAFHSFRSTLISKLRRADVPMPRRLRLAGHDLTGTQDKHYNGGEALTMFSLKTLRADIELVEYDIDFTPYTRITPKARRRRTK